MSNLRAGPYTLKDKDDDAAFQALKDDVTMVKISVGLGSPTVSAQLTSADVQALINSSITASYATVQSMVNTSIAAITVYGFHATMAAQSLAAGVSQILFDTTEFDTTGGWNLGTSTFTCNKTGYYDVYVHYYLNSLAVAKAIPGGSLRLNKNGSLLLGSSQAPSSAALDGTFGLCISATIRATSGDAFTVYNGSTPTYDADFASFSMKYLGP